MTQRSPWIFLLVAAAVGGATAGALREAGLE
mgnify:CR=1 FL=1